jgi:hypothetical protein
MTKPTKKATKVIKLIFFIVNKFIVLKN